MPRLLVTTRDGEEVAIEADAGTSVMEVIRPRFPDELLALCGGACSCATCHVYVDPSFGDKMAAASETELDLLSSSEHMQTTSRLSCQIPFVDALDGLRVTIAPDE